ncbi:MAG: hypothetical protein JW891_16530 [Candidatus Lokiarchaeota archaeon]|nr:hypothetical protein [Candidatus Lokiarchaeota archaeon]
MEQANRDTVINSIQDPKTCALIDELMNSDFDSIDTTLFANLKKTNLKLTNANALQRNNKIENLIRDLTRSSIKTALSPVFCRSFRMIYE